MLIGSVIDQKQLLKVMLCFAILDLLSWLKILFEFFLTLLLSSPDGQYPVFCHNTITMSSLISLLLLAESWVATSNFSSWVVFELWRLTVRGRKTYLAVYPSIESSLSIFFHREASGMLQLGAPYILVHVWSYWTSTCIKTPKNSLIF